MCAHRMHILGIPTSQTSNHRSFRSLSLPPVSLSLVNSSAATESMFGMIGSRDIDGPNKIDISPAVGEWRDCTGDSDISYFVRD